MVGAKEADWAVLHLARRNPLRVDVGELLQFQRPFKRGGKSGAAADEHETTCAEVFLRNRWKSV